jgi:hypothetical protein
VRGRPGIGIATRVTSKWAVPVVAVAAGAALVLPGWAGTAAAARTGQPGPAAQAAPAALGAAARIRWGKAEPVPGLAALNKGHNASVSVVWGQAYGGPNWTPGALACWGAGGCVAGGYYTDSHGHSQAWVAEERKGRWGKAIEVPGTAALNQGADASVHDVSCARTSVCAVVGTYTDKNGNTQTFTANERDGRWSTAVEVPYPALKNASIGVVWCAAGGLCAAGGGFNGPGGTTYAWVRTEVHGRWQRAVEVPGLAALNTDGDGSVYHSGLSSVSCASAGNCSAGGQYQIGTVNPAIYEPFVVTETDGTWGSAEEVPGIESVSPQGYADGNATLITCPSAGNCTAAGYDQPGNPNYCETAAGTPAVARPDVPGQPPEWTCAGSFVVNEKDGTWGQAAAAPGLTALLWLTCPAAGDCVVTGAQDTGNDVPTGELISETNDHWAAPLVLASTGIVVSVSCASPGYCAAGGVNAANSAFIISEWRGTWGKVITPGGIPAGYTASDPAGALVTSVACPPRITLCIAGGNAVPAGSTNAQAFVVSQSG